MSDILKHKAVTIQCLMYGNVIITVRNEVAKVMFLHLSVTLFTGGVCLSACWDTAPSWEQALPPGPATPRTRPPPPSSHRPEQAPPPGTRHPPPGAEAATASDGTHPTGMHSCIIIRVCAPYFQCFGHMKNKGYFGI